MRRPAGVRGAQVPLRCPLGQDRLCGDGQLLLRHGLRLSHGFAYLKDSPRNVEASLRRALQLRISCGQFSYANVKPACILGVSGTLEALGDYEWLVMSKYGFQTYSLLPSVYGNSNFRFLDQAWQRQGLKL